MSSSVQITLNSFGQANYSAAKAGIIGATKALAVEKLSTIFAIIIEYGFIIEY